MFIYIRIYFLSLFSSFHITDLCDMLRKWSKWKKSCWFLWGIFLGSLILANVQKGSNLEDASEGLIYALSSPTIRAQGIQGRSFGESLVTIYNCDFETSVNSAFQLLLFSRLNAPLICSAYGLTPRKAKKKRKKNQDKHLTQSYKNHL